MKCMRTLQNQCPYALPYERLDADRQTAELIAEKRQQADLMFRKVSITFAVYGEGADLEQQSPLT